MITNKQFNRAVLVLPVIIWLYLSYNLMLADVWDETGFLVFLQEHTNVSLFEKLEMTWNGALFGMYRPLPISLGIICTQYIHDYELIWRMLRIINIIFMILSLYFLLYALFIWGIQDIFRRLMFTILFLYSGSSFITVGWYANIFDVSCLLLISIGIFSIAKKQFLISGLTLGLSFFCKEISILIFIILIILNANNMIEKRQFFLLSIIIVCFAFIYWSLRMSYIEFGSQADIHTFSLKTYFSSLYVYTETFWWQTTKVYDNNHWEGFIWLVISIFMINKTKNKFFYLLIILSSSVIYSGMFSYQNSDELMTYLNFIGRLYFIPVTLSLFLIILYGHKKHLLLLFLFPILWGGLQTYISHLTFQTPYRQLYDLSAAYNHNERLVVNYPSQVLYINHRNIYIGNYPNAPYAISDDGYFLSN